MKINTYKYIGIVAFILVIISCSTKKDRFVNRTFHAKAAKYNVLYNGGVALETGLKDLGTTYQDNFWEVLPTEYMPDSEEELLPGETKNPNFTIILKGLSESHSKTFYEFWRCRKKFSNG